MGDVVEEAAIKLLVGAGVESKLTNGVGLIKEKGVYLTTGAIQLARIGECGDNVQVSFWLVLSKVPEDCAQHGATVEFWSDGKVGAGEGLGE